jgi:hypothetical protein
MGRKSKRVGNNFSVDKISPLFSLIPPGKTLTQRVIAVLVFYYSAWQSVGPVDESRKYFLKELDNSLTRAIL